MIRAELFQFSLVYKTYVQAPIGNWLYQSRQRAFFNGRTYAPAPVKLLRSWMHIQHANPAIAWVSWAGRPLLINESSCPISTFLRRSSIHPALELLFLLFVSLKWQQIIRNQLFNHGRLSLPGRRSLRQCHRRSFGWRSLASSLAGGSYNCNRWHTRLNVPAASPIWSAVSSSFSPILLCFDRQHIWTQA